MPPPMPSNPSYNRDYVYGAWCGGGYNVTYSLRRRSGEDRPREGDPDELEIRVERVANGEVTQDESYNYFFSGDNEFQLTKHRPSGVEVNIIKIIDQDTFQPLGGGISDPLKRGKC